MTDKIDVTGIKGVTTRDTSSDAFGDDQPETETPTTPIELGAKAMERADLIRAEHRVSGVDDHTTPLCISNKIRSTIFRLKTTGFPIEEASEIINGLVYMAKDESTNGVDALAFLEEIYKESEGMKRSLPDRIADFILASQGWFDVRDLDKECKIFEKKDKDNRRQVLHRFASSDKRFIERHPTKNGFFRRVEQTSTAIEWESADVSGIFAISFPFELENYALLYPRNIAVVTGSPDAGKTAFLLDLAKRNRDKHTIHYYSSEMAETELKVRLSKHDDIPISEWKKIDFRERSSNYADVVAQHPDDVNIIDYFEFSNAEFYSIGNELKAIYDVLHRGVCFVALQKKRGAELGRGAEFGLEKPRLYLSMDSGVLKIIKAKNWAVEGMNPNGQEFHFRLIKGAHFIVEG